MQLNLGIARYWAGEAGAEDAWKAAASLEPDTAYAVTAGNLLHPEFARNLPIFVPVDRGARRHRQACRRRRSWRCSSGVHGRGATADRLFYGVALQRLGKQQSAERVYAAAAKAAPRNPEARVAAAVGLFDKARPAQAFSILGPLSREFPEGRNGALSPWPDAALVGPGEGETQRQLELVGKTEPGSPLVGIADKYLATLRKAGILTLLLAVDRRSGDFLTGGRVRPLRSQRFDGKGQR